MSAHTKLSSDHKRVECVLERFEQERVANTSIDPVLSPIAGETSNEQFSEVAGLDRPARERPACDLLRHSGQDLEQDCEMCQTSIRIRT